MGRAPLCLLSNTMRSLAFVQPKQQSSGSPLLSDGRKNPCYHVAKIGYESEWAKSPKSGRCMTYRKCFTTSSLRAEEKPQPGNAQRNGRWPECTRSWRARFPLQASETDRGDAARELGHL